MRLLVLLIFFLHFPLLCNQTQKICISLGASPLDSINEQLPEPRILRTVTHNADTRFDEHEFLYLSGLKRGSLISASDIQRALNHLNKKNKFESACITITKVGEHEIDLHMDLISFWTFKKIKIKGVTTGREQYAHYYLLGPGERFDKKKHDLSIKKIKKLCGQRGYLQAQVNDEFFYDQETKSVYVTLRILLGRIFKVDRIVISIDPIKTEDGARNQLDTQLLNTLIEKNFSKPLQGHVYNHDELLNCEKQLKAALLKEGFLEPTVLIKENIDAQRHKVTLYLNLKTHQAKQFVFFGNHFFQDQELFDALLYFGDAALVLPASLLSEEIAHLYAKKGFWNVKVMPREEDDALYFVITEGSRVILTHVELKGCTIAQPQKLIAQFFPKLRKRNFFYDAEILKQSCELLINWYQERGYWDVAIIQQQQTPVSSTEGKLALHIDEGNRYLFKSVSVPDYPSLELESPLSDIKNAQSYLPADSNIIIVQRRFIQDYLHNKGYLYVDVKPELSFDKQDNVTYVSIIWRITFRQDKVRFGKTILLGTHSLPYHYLQRHLQYEEGDAWDKEKLEKSLQSLRELELFEHIHLHPENSSKPEQDKHIFLKVVEDDRFELRLRAGLLGISKNLTWRDAATYKAGGSLLYKNPFQRGGILSLHADLTRFERHIVASYRHPWIFHYPCKTTYKGYSNRYIQPIVIGSKDPLYVATQQGFLTGLHIKYKALTFGLNTGFEWQKTSLKSTAAAEAINFAPYLVDRYVPYFYVEPTVVLDYLNDKLTPTHGSFTVITFKGMFPTERALTFVKFLFEESVFATPIPPITLGFRFRFGHVFNQRFNQITPPERFFLGGPNTLRGYDLDFAPPLGCFNDGGKFKFVPQGGKTMINANFEIRFPIYKYISGALFQDAGLLIGDDLVSSLSKGIANHGVAATGFGVRYNTPIGPLRFDLGVKWRKFKNSDSPVAWYITLGNAF